MRNFLIPLMVLLLVFACKEEEPVPSNSNPKQDQGGYDGNGHGGDYEPVMTPEQMELRRKFLSIINDNDKYSSSGGSIDTVKIRILNCYGDSTCRAYNFLRKDNGIFDSLQLDSTDMAILEDGKIKFFNGPDDASSIPEFTLENMEVPMEAACLETMAFPYPNEFRFYKGSVLEVDTENRSLTMILWSSFAISWVCYPEEATGLTVQFYE